MDSFVVFVVLLLSSCVPSNADSIELGSSIVAGTNSSWQSSSGDYAFGFFHLLSGRYLVGIWFDKIPNKTLVWSANRDNPVEVGSTINLTKSGQFLLQPSNGVSFPIYNGTNTTTSAVMQDDGNFVLRNSLYNIIIWQSFDSPTDTLLLGQTMNMGQKLYSNAYGSVDYSTGQYSLEIQLDGNIVLKAYRFTDSAHWWSDTANNTGVKIVFHNTTTFLYVVNVTGQIIHNLTIKEMDAVQDYYYRVLVDDQGNFQKWIYHKENGSEWTSMWKAVTEPCKVTALCGVYGFCNTSDTETYSCQCLPGYTPFDPSAPSKGCYLSEVKDLCAANSSLSDSLEVKKIQDADIPNPGYFFFDLQVIEKSDLESCKRELMDDGLCMAAVLDGSNCHKKTWPIINARRVISETRDRVTLVKVPVGKYQHNFPPLCTQK